MDIRRRNNVNVLGSQASSASTIVMAHGFGCDQTVWQQLADAFSADHRVVLFDYVGCGGADERAYDERRYANLEGYAQDLLEVLDALDLQGVTLVGHSVSGMIGAIAAVQQPERFAQIVMIAPSPRYLDELPAYRGGFERADVQALLNMMEHNYTGWAHYMAPVAMKNASQPHLSDALARKFCEMDPYIARRFAEVTFFSDSRHVLPRLTTPTLVLQCTDDAIAPMEVGDYLAANIPNATLRVMQATGHCPHLSQPVETMGLIRDYLHAATA